MLAVPAGGLSALGHASAHFNLTILWCSQGEGGKVTSYDGFDESLAFIKDYIALHGPFDGLWAFSQVRDANLVSKSSCVALSQCLACDFAVRTLGAWGWM